MFVFKFIKHDWDVVENVTIVVCNFADPKILELRFNFFCFMQLLQLCFAKWEGNSHTSKGKPCA